MIFRKRAFYITFTVYLTLIFNPIIGKDVIESDEVETDPDKLEEKLSTKMIQILEHYQAEDPIGVPGTAIPDPMPIPPLKNSFPGATMKFKDMQVYGISRFKMIHMFTDVAKMKMEVKLRIENVVTKGNYTMTTWFKPTAGPFTVHLTGVTVEAIGNLGVDRKGHLHLEEITMDIKFETIDIDFQNLGLMGNVFQGILSSVGTFLFDSMKPFIQKEANKQIRGDANKEIRKIPLTFPNSASPFDMMVAEARAKVRQKGFDPFKIEDYNHTVGIVEVFLTNTWLSGLSNFYRNGNITLELYKNGILKSSFDLGTQRLKGSSHWEVQVMGGYLSKTGTFAFSVEYLKVQVALNQSLDTRKHSFIDDLQLDLGNIQVRCNGAGTLDYLVEFGVNVIPNLLRYQIMNALEGPLKQRIQGVLNTTTIDNIARDKVHLIDDMQKNGFKI